MYQPNLAISCRTWKISLLLYWYFWRLGFWSLVRNHFIHENSSINMSDRFLDGDMDRLLILEVWMDKFIHPSNLVISFWIWKVSLLLYQYFWRLGFWSLVRNQSIHENLPINISGIFLDSDMGRLFWPDCLQLSESELSWNSTYFLDF